MYDFAKLPVEIWHQILFAVIDVPFVLDTAIDTEGGCYWKRQDQYHDDDAYAHSESQRKRLRHVCRTWQAFADEQKYRWITYNSRADPGSDRQRDAAEAVGAIQAANATANDTTPDGEHGRKNTGKLKRIRFPVVMSEELQLLRILISQPSQSITILCLECPTDFCNEVFQLLIEHSSVLPSLRCLMLTQPKVDTTPLESISNAFPKLTGLTMSRYELGRHSPADKIKLVNMESLYLDVPNLDGMHVEGWEMPGLLRLIIPVADVGDIHDAGLNIIKLYGSRLVFLDLTGGAYGRLPFEFWTWCPVLTELEACFSRIELGIPVPPRHPLKYIEHSPNPLFMQSEVKEDGLLWRNLQNFPEHLELLIITTSGGWAAYVDRLETLALSARSSVEHHLREMSKFCTERSIRVEDKLGVTLETFLVTLEMFLVTL